MKFLLFLLFSCVLDDECVEGCCVSSLDNVVLWILSRFSSGSRIVMSAERFCIEFYCCFLLICLVWAFVCSIVSFSALFLYFWDIVSTPFFLCFLSFLLHTLCLRLIISISLFSAFIQSLSVKTYFKNICYY